MPIRLNGPALLARARAEGHHSQEDIACHAGIGRTALSRLIQGVYKPSVVSLVALRDAYGFPDIDSLLLGADRVVTVPAQAGAAE
ncbi:helix-turn-helix transcriptional regulator [Streptomyces sp. NPDC047070]|uniref:helix-turn-helix domain-containing protein n=1 Tax=Streptomyces sp. NPDC047070 TaxID=3154923 RepID=UPI003453BE1F